MKNLLFKCVLLSLFILGTWNSNAAVICSELDGGGVVDLLGNDKMIQSSFFIPDEYISDDGTLSIPLTISIYNKSRERLYFKESLSSSITIPSLKVKHSTIYLHVEIGEYTTTRTIITP